MTTKIKLISPVLFSAGEFLNGAELAASTWVMTGEAEMALRLCGRRAALAATTIIPCRW
jgi:hypothetical protein